MDIQNIILIIIAVLDLFLGFLILKRNHKNEINISYSLYVLWVVLWTLGIAFFRATSNYEVMLFSNIVFIISSALIFSSILHFSYLFPDQKPGLTVRKRILIYLPNILVILAAVIPGVMIKDIFIRDWGNESILGWAYIYYAIYVSIISLLAFKNLFVKLLESDGIAKAQIFYVVLGLFVSLVFGATFNLLFILLGNYKFIWLGPYASFIMLLFIGYAILRYRLMDIRIVARKMFIYTGVATFTYGIFYILIWLYTSAFGSVFSKSAYIAGIFIAPIFVACFLGIMKLLKIFANKYLFYSLYNYQETLNTLSRELNYYTDFNKIINAVVNSVKETMKLDRGGVLLVNQEKEIIHYKIAKVVGFNKENGISLVQDNFLTKHLEKTQRLLVREELSILAKEARIKKNKNSFLKLQEHMRRIEASVCLPLMSGKKIIGIMVLGSKISGDAYTKEDLELLETLANQAGIAIDNARLYKEVKDFSKTLQQKVDDQTQSLQKTNKQLNNKNKLNKELLEMKSDFLRVVNHQLNTPLSIMRGYFSMLEEGSYKPKQAMPAIKDGLDRINQTVADFWDAYELEGERMKMKPTKVDITAVVDKLIKEKKSLPLAKQRALKISGKKSNFKIPVVWCDFKKVAHVVSNLLDNAVFYTYKGEVELFYKLVGKEYLKISVRDTGVGLSASDQKNLFKKFSRGKKASGMHPDGSGLGLYIARKIVEGNNGEMTVESEGEGKGSVFSLTIPIYKNQKPENGEETVTRGKKIEIF